MCVCWCCWIYVSSDTKDEYAGIVGAAIEGKTLRVSVERDGLYALKLPGGGQTQVHLKAGCVNRVALE
jgi:hypothetical protein